MAESPQEITREPGAPIAKDAVDPELIKLGRPRAKIGLVTAAGMVLLCTLFLLKLLPDRRFGSEPDEPRPVTVAEVASGKVPEDSYIALEAEPMMAHAIRANKNKGELGLRVVPARGSGERVWLVLDGVGWDPPVLGRYQGRLRKLADLPFEAAMRDHARAQPRPVFALATTVRAGFATTTIRTVDGDEVKVSDTDRVAFDVIDPALAAVVATFTGGTPDHTALLDGAAWTAELARLGIPATPLPPDDRDRALGQVRFDVTMPVPAVTEKLEAAKLWAARVEPVTRHHQTTWGELEKSPAGSFTFGTTSIPEAQLDLVGIHATRAIPADAYVLIANEKPQEFWYILPILIAVALIGLLFLWGLIRTIRRDLLPSRA
ncbi:MAG: hypothetical protein H0X17_21810 [Deltaproteobacteria bacterium]|nr:hypothetical protein [Deltaproteobacteria bacterium]